MSQHGSSETSSFGDECWASWFCNLSGNQFYCEIDKAYIEDSFNLFGLKQHVIKDYSKALDTILDRLAPSETESDELSRSATLLYGLIHARFIITAHGLEAMHRKYLQREFGECPRVHCRGQAVLPMGLSDEPKHSKVMLFCPKCQDVYNCTSNHRHIDGAFFGPTFPHLFLMTYEHLVPEPAAESFVPRVFGFRIHPSSGSLPRAPLHHNISRYRRGFPAGSGAVTLMGAGGRPIQLLQHQYENTIEQHQNSSSAEHVAGVGLDDFASCVGGSKKAPFGVGDMDPLLMLHIGASKFAASDAGGSSSTSKVEPHHRDRGTESNTDGSILKRKALQCAGAALGQGEGGGGGEDDGRAVGKTDESEGASDEGVEAEAPKRPRLGSP